MWVYCRYPFVVIERVSSRFISIFYVLMTPDFLKIYCLQSTHICLKDDTVCGYVLDVYVFSVHF